MGVRIKVTDLQPGMILAENLVSDEGTVVLPAGRKLNEEDIQKLATLRGLRFAVVEGDNVLLSILEETERKVDEELKEEVKRALRYCCASDEQLKRQLYLLGVRYRSILRER